MRISTGNFDSFFFLRVKPFLNLEIWPKWKILLKQFVSATPLKPIIRIRWNFVVVKYIPCRFAFNFFSRSYSLFKLRNLGKMKDTTETVCQRNFSENPHQNYMKLCGCELKDIMCRCAYLKEFFIRFFLSESRPFWT